MKEYHPAHPEKQYKIGEEILLISREFTPNETIKKLVGIVEDFGITMDAVSYVKVKVGDKSKKYVTSGGGKPASYYMNFEENFQKSMLVGVTEIDLGITEVAAGVTEASRGNRGGKLGGVTENNVGGVTEV